MAIDTMPPLIAAQLNYLISHFPVPIKVDKVWSGCKNPTLLDRFTLVIPYCLDYIKWDVLYNALYPLAAPDVIFGPENEGFNLFAGNSGKSILADWNCRDPTRLLSFIKELRDAFIVYQKRRIGEIDDDRLKFEISTMVSREGIETYVVPGAEKPEEVKFAIPLLMNMDFNKLVAGSNWKKPQKIYLQAIFPVGKTKSSTPPPPRLKLIASPEMKVLFSVDEFKLPSWLDGMCTAEYLDILEDVLESKITDAVSLIEIRRKLIIALAPSFGRPIEADPVFCRRATFLNSSGVFIFLVHLSLSPQFPKQKPAITLQSTQHFNSQGVPVKSASITDYPWSPRWEPSEMAERIFDFLAEECLNFKKHCNQSNQQ